MEGYDTLHDLLVKLFNEIMNIEEKAIITEEFKDISNNDMHIIEAIGLDEPRSMSSVAKDLSVTVGTLTIAINNLVKKAYVKRVRSEKDRRVVLISLTEKGRIQICNNTACYCGSYNIYPATTSAYWLPNCVHRRHSVPNTLRELRSDRKSTRLNSSHT